MLPKTPVRTHSYGMRRLLCALHFYRAIHPYGMKNARRCEQPIRSRTCRWITRLAHWTDSDESPTTLGERNRANCSCLWQKKSLFSLSDDRLPIRFRSFRLLSVAEQYQLHCHATPSATASSPFRPGRLCIRREHTAKSCPASIVHIGKPTTAKSSQHRIASALEFE